MQPLVQMRLVSPTASARTGTSGYNAQWATFESIAGFLIWCVLSRLYPAAPSQLSLTKDGPFFGPIHTLGLGFIDNEMLCYQQ